MGTPSRADSADTQKRLLEAATQVFADKGFADATTAQICEAARANAAAISYHFGGKQGMYKAVWQQTASLMTELYPPDAGMSGDEPAEVRLRAYIHNFVNVVTDDSVLGHFHRLQLHEMIAPTGVVQEIFRKNIAPRRQRMLGVIQELVGPDVGDGVHERCLYSVISQCRSVSFVKSRSMPVFGRKKLTRQDFAGLADHITDLCLAGFRALNTNAAPQGRAPRPTSPGPSS